MAWTHRNLATQGHCLSAEEARRQAAGLRFPTGLCLALVAVAIALALALGVLLLAACAVVTVFNFCVPSELLALWEGRRQPRREVASA